MQETDEERKKECGEEEGRKLQHYSRLYKSSVKLYFTAQQ